MSFENFGNFGNKRPLKTVNEEDVSEKIKQMKEITQCDEDKCFFVLHDCNYNVEMALNKLLSVDQDESNWKKSKGKSKKPSKETKSETNETPETNITNDEIGSSTDVLENNCDDQRFILSAGRTFKNLQLSDNILPVTGSGNLINQSFNLYNFDVNNIWNGKSIVVQNSKNLPHRTCEVLTEPIKNNEKLEPEDPSIIFKTHCTTKPPPKINYSLASAVQMVNKPVITNANVPKFKFGDTKLLYEQEYQQHQHQPQHKQQQQLQHQPHHQPQQHQQPSISTNSKYQNLPKTKTTNNVSNYRSESESMDYNTSPFNSDNTSLYFTNSKFATDKFQTNLNNNIHKSLITTTDSLKSTNNSYPIKYNIPSSINQSLAPQHQAPHQPHQSHQPHQQHNIITSLDMESNTFTNNIVNQPDSVKHNNNDMNKSHFTNQCITSVSAQNNYPNKYYIIPNNMVMPNSMNGIYMTLNNAVQNTNRSLSSMASQLSPHINASSTLYLDDSINSGEDYIDHSHRHQQQHQLNQTLPRTSKKLMDDMPLKHLPKQPVPPQSLQQQQHHQPQQNYSYQGNTNNDNSNKPHMPIPNLSILLSSFNSQNPPQMLINNPITPTPLIHLQNHHHQPQPQTHHFQQTINDMNYYESIVSTHSNMPQNSGKPW